MLLIGLKFLLQIFLGRKNSLPDPSAAATAHMTGMTDTMIDDRWARHGIAAERAREWQALGFGVLDAAAWSHHKIAPVDARAWERAGFYGGDLPSRAALWHHGGFTPQQAIGWGALPDRSPGGWVFPPSIAVSFRDAGFTPARASPWWRRGFTAAAAEKWRDDRFPVAVAERWVNGGFGDPDTAAPWIEAGATPAEAALFMRTCLDVDDAIEWRDRGFDPGSVSGWVAAGFTPDDAPEWAARWIQPVDAESWRAAGFCAVEAFMWRAQRIEPAAARFFVARGLRHWHHQRKGGESAISRRQRVELRSSRRIHPAFGSP